MCVDVVVVLAIVHFALFLFSFFFLVLYVARFMWHRPSATSIIVMAVMMAVSTLLNYRNCIRVSIVTYRIVFVVVIVVCAYMWDITAGQENKLENINTQLSKILSCTQLYP